MGKARQVLPVLAFLFLFQRAGLGQQPIHWDATIDSAKAAAAQSNRLVLVFFSAGWCGACHGMEDDLRNQPGAVAAMETDFVPVKIGYDYFPNTAKQYGVTRLPTTVILAPNAAGDVLAVISERMPVDQYLGKLTKVAADFKRRDAGLYAQIQPSPAVGAPAGPPPTTTAAAGKPADPFRPATGTVQSQPKPAWKPGDPPAPTLGLDGYCPVQLIESARWQRGQKAVGAIHRGRVYLFAGVEERRRFMADPDRFAPVNSGDDVVLAIEQGRAVPGFREHGVQFEGHVFLFADEASLEKFRSNPHYYAERALQAIRPASGSTALR